PEHRAADLARVRAEMQAHFRQRRLQVVEQALEGFAHLRLVVVLVVEEPRALVVARQRAQELQRLVGEIGGHAREACRCWPQAWSWSSRARRAASPACSARSVAMRSK